MLITIQLMSNKFSMERRLKIVLCNVCNIEIIFTCKMHSQILFSNNNTKYLNVTDKCNGTYRCQINIRKFIVTVYYAKSILQTSEWEIMSEKLQMYLKIGS